MKPMTRGERARSLREALGASQKLVEELSRLSHSQVSKAEGRDIGWRSRDVINGFARAFSMTSEQWEEFIEGRMLQEQAMRIARPRIEAAKAKALDEDNLEAIARNAVKLADIDEKWAQATVSLLRIQMRDHGVPTTAELTAEATRIAHGIQTLAARRRPDHKSDRTDRVR